MRCNITRQSTLSFPLIKSFCGGARGKGGRFEVKKGRRVGQKPSVRFKASKPFLYENSNTLYGHQHFDAFSAVGGIPSCPEGTNSINN